MMNLSLPAATQDTVPVKNGLETQMVKTSDMVRQSEQFCLQVAAMASNPFGHTEYQIRKFILNEQEFPGPERFRQAIRELWARREACLQIQYRLEDLEIEEQLLVAERMKVKTLPALTPWGKLKKAAKLEDVRNKLIRVVRTREDLILSLEHRVLRESQVLLDEAKKIVPEDSVKAFSLEEDGPRREAMYARAIQQRVPAGRR